MLADRRLWADKLAELRLWLQRRFWRSLGGTMEIFHVLPLLAAVVLLALFATDGQFREIYISYLEGPSGDFGGWAARMLAGLASLTLVSAALFESHSALSTMRINVVFASRPSPESYSSLLRLQRAAGFTLAFLPWLGLAVGLFGARNFVVARYCQLLDVAGVDAETLSHMQFLPQLTGIEIAVAATVLGATIAYLVRVDDLTRPAQWAVGCVTWPLLALLFLLGCDWLDPNPFKWLTTAPVWQPVGLAAIVSAATVFYLFSYQRLYHRRGGFLFSNLFSRTGFGFRKRRGRRLVVWSFLPWLAFALYFSIIRFFVNGSTPVNGCQVNSLANIPTAGRWAIFPVAITCCVAVGLSVSYLLLQIDSAKRLRSVICVLATLIAAAMALAWINDAGVIVSVYRFIGPLATADLELAFLLATFAVLAWLSQESGFPALTLIVLTMIICAIFPSWAWLTALSLGIAYCLFAVIALLSGRIWVFSVLLLPIAAGVINVIEFNEGARVPPNLPPDKTAPLASSTRIAPTVQTAYLCWLDQRGIPAKRITEQASCPDRPEQPTEAQSGYPVFIFSTEGGGIYAASAAALFLAKLEDDQPRFARHIFAISGVSGGAIGTTVFEALDGSRYADSYSSARPSTKEGDPQKQVDQGPDSEERCTKHGTENAGIGLIGEVTKIMEDDHFSPIIGAIFPEIFGAPLRRPDAQRASFEYSTFTQDADAGTELCDRFLMHWRPTGMAPALVLNSTWVETGFRVAFAPFRLHDIDESLYSFLDASMPNENCSNKGDTQSCVSLMTAAGVSARFPGIMPPFSVAVEMLKAGNPDNKDTDRRWNFVDGAYADNSGAATAMDIYRVLKKVTNDLHLTQNVDLRIVLITSSIPQPDLNDRSINGTVFRDTVAPIDAMLKVREDLGNEAVARACSEIYPNPTPPDGHAMEFNERCVQHAGVEAKSPLQIVEIQDQTYGLSLGWKISQTSFAVIEWMLGMLSQPANCAAIQSATQTTSDTQQNDHALEGQTTAPNSTTPYAQLTKSILERNSCAAQLLANLVRKSSASADK
jgi:hypothetical protein